MPRSKSPRASGRGSIKAPYEKGKGKKKRRAAYNSKVDEKHVASMSEVSDKTLTRLHILGNQRFGSSPFREHFERWLLNLTEVLSEFESNPNISPDDQFVTERSQILSNVDCELEQRRREENSLEETLKSLTSSKFLLGLIKQEYATKAGEIGGRKRSEIRRLYKNIEILRESWMG